MTAFLLTDNMEQLGEGEKKTHTKTRQGKPLKIHLLNKRFLSYVTRNGDLNIDSRLDLETDLVQARAGANAPLLNRAQKSRQGKGHLFGKTLLSMLYLAAGRCQALSQMAGSDSSHPQRRYSTVQHKISDILSH